MEQTSEVQISVIMPVYNARDYVSKNIQEGKENEKKDFSSNHGSLREYDSTACRCTCSRRQCSSDRKHAENITVREISPDRKHWECSRRADWNGDGRDRRSS